MSVSKESLMNAQDQLIIALDVVLHEDDSESTDSEPSMRGRRINLPVHDAIDKNPDGDT